MSDISVFRSNLGDRSLAKSNRFEVLVHPPDFMLAQDGMVSNEFRFMAHEAELPSRAFEARQYREWGPEWRAPDQVTYSDASITFYTKDDMKEWVYFHKWMFFIHDEQRFNFLHPHDYWGELQVNKLSEIGDGMIMQKVFLRECYPINIQPVSLAWSEEGVVRVTVQFSFISMHIGELEPEGVQQETAEH